MESQEVTAGRRDRHLRSISVVLVWAGATLAIAGGLLPEALLLVVATVVTVALAAEQDRSGRLLAAVLAAAGISGAVIASAGRLTPVTGLITVLSIAGAAEYLATRTAHRARALHQAQAKARLLQDIIDTAPSMIFVKNRQSRLTFVNETVRQFIGRSDAELLGCSDEAFGCSAEATSAFQASDRHALESVQPVHYPAEILEDHHGIAHWFESIKVALPDDGGDASILVIGTDVTDRVRTEQLTRTGGQLLEALAEATAVLLAEPSLDTGISSALHYIGEAIQVDRIEVFKNSPIANAGRLGATRRYVWPPFSTSAERGTAAWEQLSYEPAFSNWLAQFRAGQPIVGRVSQLDAAARAILSNQGIHATYALPIYAASELWGFVAFQNYQDAQTIPEALHPALGTLANSLGAAIAQHDARQAVLRQEQAMRTMLDVLPSLVVLKEPDGRIRFVNQALADFLKLPRDEIIGRRDTDIYPQQAADDPGRNDDQHVITEQAEVVYNLRPVRDPSGINYWYHTVKRPLFDQVTGERLILSVSTNVSELKQAEEALEAERSRLRVLIDNLPDLIYIKDRQSRYVTANAAHLALLGAGNAADIVGRRDHDFFSHDSSEPFYREEQGIMASNTAVLERVEEINVDTPDRRRWVLASKIPLTDSQGAVTGLIVISRDITTLKQSEEALRAAKETAEAATAAKSAFLATMSHEIRTPMNAVIAMTGLLQDTKLTPEQADFVNTIRVGGESLLAVINDILDFSKIEAGKLELEAHPFNLVELAEETMHLLAPRASQKLLNLRLSLGDDVPAWVTGDAARLRQILLNLLNNAVKFTASGEVNLSIAASGNRQQRRLHFAVQDTGIGIPAERMNRLFQSFSQVDSSTTRRFGGTGLGLAICKRLVELMDGTIAVESEPGVGSTFTFDIVMADAEPEQSPRPGLSSLQMPAATADGALPLRILLAEDNTINQKVALRVLERLGHSASVVDDGLQAVIAAGLQRYDVILMDVHMPEMNGLDATRRIRAETPPERQPYIIALTADAAEGYEQRCIESGMDAFVVKPIRIDELAAALVKAREQITLVAASAGIEEPR